MEVKRYHLAKTIKEAYEILLQDDNAQIIAGGAWLKQVNKDISTIIDLKALNLDQIIENDAYYEIGSMVTLRTLEVHEGIGKLLGGIVSESISHIMGVNFRNIATIGGSIYGRYAFSDIITALLTCKVTLHFHDSGAMDLEAFLLKRGSFKDILTHIHIYKSKGKSYFKKVSNTRLDFAMLNIAVSHWNGKYYIALGSRPGSAILIHEAMTFLNEQDTLSDKVINESLDLMLANTKFGTNHRASDKYRIELAKTYVKRGLNEVKP
ncbi:MAG: FAD binding domain-containing protein [Candidatus Izemoplasmataceae bacterium]|uniref:FAD binding domain-containing protein n=1 Tax=Liberiplasma polymorphum TaxID=3374570 RepID=UPI003770A1EB